MYVPSGVPQARPYAKMIAVAAPYLPQPGRCSSVAEQLFRKQQVAGSIPITGSILLKLNQADFGKSQRSITEKCPPTFNLASISGAKGPGLSPGLLLFDSPEGWLSGSVRSG